MSTELLETAASALGELRSRVVFLGGSTITLWMTDPASREPRVTYDVDVVAEVVTLAQYEEFQAELRRRGFAEDIDSGVICRWMHKETNLLLDAVPLDARLAGFSGVWLSAATRAAVEQALPSGTTIRVVPPVELLATKLEAFTDRGNDDCLASRDFEDIALLIDSRPELASEILAGDPKLANYICSELARVQDLPGFDYGIEGAVAGAGAADRARSVTLPRWHSLARGHRN